MKKANNEKVIKGNYHIYKKEETEKFYRMVLHCNTSVPIKDILSLMSKLMKFTFEDNEYEFNHCHELDGNVWELIVWKK